MDSAYEFNNLGHFDLGEDAAGLVSTQVGGIADGEGIGTFDSDLPGLASVELSHTLYFGECNKVAIFETMSSFIQAGYQAL